MTITFEKDWKDEQGHLRAIPHITTKNKSFLRTAQLLRRMGIKNYAFMLALYDPDLVNVDPFDLEENTKENEILRMKVQIEARRNGWYYLRECSRIYEQGGAPVPFRLDRGSCAMAWCFFNGIDYASMQPRQTGKAQPLDAKILTTKGWITMGEVTHSTRIITPDGSDAAVVGIYPQGEKPIWRITLVNGQTTECCDEHLWKVSNSAVDPKWYVTSFESIRKSWQRFYVPIYDPVLKNVCPHEIVKVENVGRKLAQCIEIDHVDHLYVTDDYIVTHNTVCALSLTGWVMWIHGREFQIGMQAKDNTLRQENVKRVRAFGENLPPWWLAKDKFKDKNNAEELFYDALRTHYITMVAQKDPSQADKQARGNSPPMIHWDEFEFINNIGISYPTMIASTGTARENSKKNGQPHSNLITTTAGDPSKKECQEAMKILKDAMPFTELLYDIKDAIVLDEVVKATSPKKMILGVFSHLQLGYDNNWLREKIIRTSATPDQVMRDYLNRRVSIQDSPVIPKETLALINSSQREPSYIEIMKDKFVIYWYLEESVVKSASFKDRPIVVGCDSSEMIGRDATTLIGIDPRTLETVFSFRCTEGNINVTGVMIADLLMKYPKIVWVPENKSSGTSLIDIVAMILRREGHNPFYRIFNWIVNNRHEEEFAKFDLRDGSLLNTSAKRYFGIKTDKSKRAELYGSTLLQGAKRAASRIKDQTLIQELGSLTVRNGRVDHPEGGHDDTVVAWLMAMWFILNGKHLDLYGIKPGTVLSQIHPGSPDKNKLSQEHQMMVIAKIEELEKALKMQRDPGLRKYIESNITMFKGMVDHGPLPTPDTADDLTRDPRKFTDRATAEQSRRPVNSDDLERSIRGLMRIM